MSERDSWHLREGEPITAELTAMRLLGGGSAYEAYLAFDEVTYGPVVVKVLRPGQTQDASSRRGLRREVSALTAVSHPVVVRALRHVDDGDRPHLVLEHVDGPRLSSLIRRYGPLQEQQYLPLAIDVAAALHYFRRVGYVHLDIKPSNVIMGSPARLIDLSVMRTVEDAASLTYVIGTDAYLSPEQADPGSVGVPGPPSDVWGLGATLYHAVAGERPYAAGDPAGTTPLDRHPQVAAAVAALPDRTPAEVVEVVRACLERRPEDRPQPREVADALQPVLERQPRARLSFKVSR